MLFFKTNHRTSPHPPPPSSTQINPPTPHPLHTNHLTPLHTNHPTPPPPHKSPQPPPPHKSPQPHPNPLHTNQPTPSHKSPHPLHTNHHIHTNHPTPFHTNHHTSTQITPPWPLHTNHPTSTPSTQLTPSPPPSTQITPPPPPLHATHTTPTTLHTTHTTPTTLHTNHTTPIPLHTNHPLSTPPPQHKSPHSPPHSTHPWWWWSRASCLWMSVDILGTNCDQCLNMVQCCFTSTETLKLIRTESPGRPPRLSHSSWTLNTHTLFLLMLVFATYQQCVFVLFGCFLFCRYGVYFVCFSDIRCVCVWFVIVLFNLLLRYGIWFCFAMGYYFCAWFFSYGINAVLNNLECESQFCCGLCKWLNKVAIYMLESTCSMSVYIYILSIIGHSLTIGRFSEVGLHKWMPFTFFHARSREWSKLLFPGQFLSSVASRCV